MNSKVARRAGPQQAGLSRHLEARQGAPYRKLEGRGPYGGGGKPSAPVAVLCWLGDTRGALRVPGNLGRGVSGQNMPCAVWPPLAASDRLGGEAGGDEPLQHEGTGLAGLRQNPPPHSLPRLQAKGLWMKRGLWAGGRARPVPGGLCCGTGLPGGQCALAAGLSLGGGQRGREPGGAAVCPRASSVGAPRAA